MESFRTAKSAVAKPADWLTVIAFLKALQKMQPNDPYLIQQLALATYKSEVPDKLAALVEAKRILEQLAPATSSDAETVGLWGAVHKRLWETTGTRPTSTSRSGRTRAATSSRTTTTTASTSPSSSTRARRSPTGDEALADRVVARRIRREVLALCEELARRGHACRRRDAFWVLATRVEALVRSWRRRRGRGCWPRRIAKAPQAWMAATMVEQIAKLKALGAAEDAAPPLRRSCIARPCLRAHNLGFGEALDGHSRAVRGRARRRIASASRASCSRSTSGRRCRARSS